jgi:hypothetical protein
MEDEPMENGREARNHDDERARTFWHTQGDHSLVLWIDGRRRAEVDYWFNCGQIVRTPRVFQREEPEHVVLPLEQSIVGEVERRLGLRAPAPIIGDAGLPVPELRSEIEDQARYYREKRYLDIPHPRQKIIDLLTEAHDRLNDAASLRVLDRTANDARFLCGEALRELEKAAPRQPNPFSDRAVAAIKNAALILNKHNNEVSPVLRAYPFNTAIAQYMCDLALEHVEKAVKDARPCRPRERDLDRER